MNYMYDEYGCCASCGYTYCPETDNCIRLWEEDCPTAHRILSESSSEAMGTRMEDFNINELMLFIVGVLGALGGLCVILQKSKCSKISFCGMGCERDVSAVIKEEKIKAGLPTTHIPPVEEAKQLIKKKDIKLELKK